MMTFKIIQACRDHDGAIVQSIGAIAERITHDTRHIHPADGVFNRHPQAGQLGVGGLLLQEQRPPGGFFSGVIILTPSTTYPW